jgi:hypothetical protein
MLNRCDVVFIPSNDTPAKRAKGQARPIAAIQAGRVAIAFPLPQYEPLSDFCFLGRDYAESLAAALTNTTAAERRVAAGQRYIDKNFSQEACADAWRRLIVQVMDGSYKK